MNNTEEKVLVHEPALCTGCMRCMTTCSTYNNGATSLTRSRIQIMRHEGHTITNIDEESELIFEAIMCQQCDRPFCLNFCPVRAIRRDTDTHAMVINYDKCIGCRMCITVCPFGAPHYDQTRKQIFKCTLCDGDPQCVKFCPTESLKFLSKEAAHTPQVNYLSQKIMQRYTGAIK